MSPVLLKDDSTGNNGTTLDLPPDIWERILLQDLYQLSGYRHHCHLKQLSLVNRLFAQICQSRLFSSFSIQTFVALRYSSERGARTPELDWKAWEDELQSVVQAERRLALVAGHAFLASQPRGFVVKGYECRRSYPLHPFERPPERGVLSRSVFDAFTHLREALHLHLAAFSNLRKLQISNYPVTTELLNAFDAHPSLTELSFNFCWFPKSTSPLTSIILLSFHEIPGSHVRRHYLSSNYDPYENVPDYYVRSAFNLISPSHIESLDVTFGRNCSHILPVFEQLCATAPGAVFRRLKRLIWRFDSKTAAPPDGALIFQFLKRTPALRELSVYGQAPLLSPGSGGTPTPTTHCPLLESLVCPLGWARVLTPGRPLTSLTLGLDTGASSLTPQLDPSTSFLARTPHDLSALLHRLTLSTAPTGITSLHLPPYPPLAPISLLHSFLSAHFSGVRDLGIAVAEEDVPEEFLEREGRPDTYVTHDIPGLPWAKGLHDEVADGALVERLEREVRGAVEAELRVSVNGGDDLGHDTLPPVTDRVAAYLRENAFTDPESTEPGHHPSDAASQLEEIPGPNTTSSASTAPSALLQPPTMSLLQMPHVALLPLPPLVDPTVTDNGVPAPQPVAHASPPILVAPISAPTTDDGSEHERDSAMPKYIEDYMHLLSLGVYTLPASIETLTLRPHFRPPPLGYCQSWRQEVPLECKGAQKQSAIERTGLSQLAGLYPGLETLEINHRWERASVRYHKRNGGGGGWEKYATGEEGMNSERY